LKQSEKEFNNFCRQEYYGWEDNFTETPATDALLAEVRAQGVDMARNAMIDFVDGEVGPNKNVPGLIRGAEICVSIAEQLRKGGNQCARLIIKSFVKSLKKQKLLVKHL
ncbi:TPA: hypothetical protein ACIX00_005592, partial [Escherichia coli]